MGGDTVRQQVGFREVKIENARLLVNGKMVYIKGVNRHEHNDSLGHVQSHEIMMDNLRRLRELNINAVRSSHYPNCPEWLDLCDKYGIYVVDEANIETHGMGTCISPIPFLILLIARNGHQHIVTASIVCSIVTVTTQASSVGRWAMSAAMDRCSMSSIAG